MKAKKVSQNEELNNLPQEEITNKNIKDYKNFSHKKLYKFNKPRSPLTIEFITRDPEEWFINVVRYRTKSGIIVSDETIIAKDIPGWIEWLQNLGWEIIN